MARRLRRFYLQVRRLVDHDLGTNSRPASPIAGAVFLLPMAFVRQTGAPWPVVVAVWALCGALAIAWTAFAFWRAWRVLSAKAVKDDRHFDREGKFSLPPEYWPTESLTRSRRKRRRRKGVSSP